MSPSAMSEESRRELIARQHRALYGNEAAAAAAAGFPQSGYSDDGNTPREPSSGVPTSSAGGMRGNSPRGMDPFGMSQSAIQGGSSDNNNAQSTSAATQDSGRGDRSASPLSSGTGPTQYSNFDNAAQQSGKTTSPSGGESPTRQIAKSTTAPIGSGMGLIGSRPTQQQQAQNAGLNKRTTSPLPSLNYGFGPNENNSSTNNNNERAGSSNSNNNAQKDSGPNPAMSAWGTGSGVWGSNKIGATSVWG